MKHQIKAPAAEAFHRLYLLSDYPLLSGLAANRTLSKKLDGRACAEIYSDALPDFPWLNLSDKELDLMRSLGIARTRAELIQAVRVHPDPETNKPRFIVISEIPRPWREQFSRDLYGATCLGHPVLGPCAFATDWEAWSSDLWYGGVMRPLGLQPDSLALPRALD